LQRSQVQDKAPCPDVITLPQDIDRDINYAANQVIYTFGTDVHCGVQMQLHAPNIQVFDTLLLAKENCTAPLVQAYPGPCPELKYTEGFSQQSTAQYTYDTGGNMTYDPNKKLTFYYNHHNLPYRIVGAENDELQMLYAADGSLLQRKYIKNNVEVSKTDYLRGKELKNGLMESVYHNDGRVIKSGALWKYEYQIKDHLGNVRVTFTDDNNDGITERKSINDYYSFGMEWNNKWELGDTLSPENKYRYNGKEFVEEMGWDNLMYGARYYNPTLGIFHGVDAWADKYPSWAPYSYTLNNPIKFTDPTGNGVEGDIYNNKGVHIGNDGKADQKVFLLNTDSDKQLSQQQSLEMTTNFENNCAGSSCINGSDFSQVNITNDELNIKATLSTIRESEGHGTPTAYNSQFGGGTFDDYSKHPNKKIKKWKKTSTAAGAYQFLGYVWEEHAKKLGLSDFTPESQDKAAMYEIGLVKGASEAIKSGKYSTALRSLSVKWTSLPGGRHEWKSSVDNIFLKNRAKLLNP